MSWVHVSDYSSLTGWANPAKAQERSRYYCEQLEAGRILFFPTVPFVFPRDHIQALLAKKQSNLRFHKNISYQPQAGSLRGMASDNPADEAELHAIMRHYSDQATGFVGDFLRPYVGKMKLDFASYRPVEECGRQLTLHRRNDLLHVDAFPSRPTRGGRILRVFVNLNPAQPRSWITSENFTLLARRHAEEAGLKTVARRAGSWWWKALHQLAALPHLFRGRDGVAASAYDQFMLRFHNWLKENDHFQRTCPKTHHEFPPGACWLVYTDSVPHAVLGGQFAIEQTYIIDVEGMVTPHQAPIRVLEELCGRRLAA